MISSRVRSSSCADVEHLTEDQMTEDRHQLGIGSASRVWRRTEELFVLLGTQCDPIHSASLDEIAVRHAYHDRETGQTDQVASTFVRSTMASTTRSSTGCT